MAGIFQKIREFCAGPAAVPVILKDHRPAYSVDFIDNSLIAGSYLSVARRHSFCDAPVLAMNCAALVLSPDQDWVRGGLLPFNTEQTNEALILIISCGEQALARAHAKIKNKVPDLRWVARDMRAVRLNALRVMLCGGHNATLYRAGFDLWCKSVISMGGDPERHLRKAFTGAQSTRSGHLTELYVREQQRLQRRTQRMG